MVMTTRPSQPRLPADGPRNRAAEVVRGLLALLAIVVIVVAVPVALALGFGTPWPGEVPSEQWLYRDFDARDGLAVLVGVVWLAWLHFCVCLVVEVVGERRGRGLTPHVPGGSVGTQPLARRLVGAVLLLTGGLAATVPSASAVTADVAARDQGRPAAVSEARPGARLGTLDQPATAQPEHSDRRHAAFTEREDGRVHRYVEVQPPEGRNYDTLWGIAERYLGNGLRYKEIVELNRGVLQPDGRSLQNPDLIHPGWVLRLPADAEGPGLRVAERAAVDRPAAPERELRPGAADEEADLGAGEARSDGGSERAGGAGGSQGADAGAGSDEAASATTSALALTGFGAGGGLLAAGLLLGLRRRRGWDGGPNPRGGKKLDREFELRGAADESSAAFVESVLRHLPQAVPSGSALPAPTSCLLGADGLVMTFGSGSAVELTQPWRADGGHGSWYVRRGDVPATPPLTRALSPVPTLVPLGRSGDVETLVDLESLGGIVSLSGDLEAARDVAVGLGLALATSRWADEPRVTFVGFADDLSPIAPQAVRHYDELAQVLDRLELVHRRQVGACGRGGHDTVRTGRLAEPDARLWAPELLVLSGVPSADEVDRLAGLASDPRNAIAVVVVGDVPSAPVRLVASTEGRLWCGPLGIDVAGHRVTAAAYRDVLTLFDDDARGGSRGPDGPPAGAAAVPVVDPDALEAAARLPLNVTTLGPVTVTAPGEVDPRRRELLTELVIYLALHPEGVHPNVLSAAVWPRGVTDEVRDAALAQAAGWLGVTSQGVPRLRVGHEGRWLLDREGLRFDWDVFRALASRSAVAASPADDLEQALALVQGPAWTGLPAGRYGWLAYESVEADMRLAVVAVARRLAATAADAGDPQRARRALQAGLRMVPACEELWRDALALAHRFGGPGDVRAVADDLYAAIRRLGSPRGPEAETDALVDELLPGYRRGSAA